MLGTASTGTAIATLSGASAFNATMAWFGGGALAAGGAGMAGGGLMLSGLVAIPLVAFASSASYSKATKMDEETANVIAAQKEIEKSIPALREYYHTARSQTNRLSGAFQTLCNRSEKIEDTLFPLGILSKVWRSVRGISGFGYFLIAEAFLLTQLNDCVSDFVCFFDVRQSE